MYKLVAIAIEDGWAYLTRDDKYYLIRPPYENLNIVNSEEITYAINFLGFLEKEFINEDLDEIVKYIQNQSEIFYQEEDLEITSKDLDEFFEHSSKEEFKFLLNCIDNNLILEGKILEARNFITDIKSHSSSKKYDLTANLKEIDLKCEKADSSINYLKKYDLPNVKETYRITQKIQSRRQIFPVRELEQKKWLL